MHAYWFKVLLQKLAVFIEMKVAVLSVVHVDVHSAGS